jgi:hypothetical protein
VLTSALSVLRCTVLLYWQRSVMSTRVKKGARKATGSAEDSKDDSKDAVKAPAAKRAKKGKDEAEADSAPAAGANGAAAAAAAAAAPVDPKGRPADWPVADSSVPIDLAVRDYFRRPVLCRSVGMSDLSSALRLSCVCCVVLMC